MVLFNSLRFRTANVFHAWSLRFLYKCIFVVAWTLIVAMFVAHLGLVFLPALFLFNGFFSFIGGYFFSVIFEFFSKTRLMFLILFFSSGLLLLNLVLFYDFPAYFFSILLFIEAFLMTQFKILLDSYLEEGFEGEEAKSVFPVLESADTLASIFVGILFFLFAFSFEIANFLWVWLALNFLTLLILFFPKFPDVPYRKQFRRVSYCLLKKILNSNSGDTVFSMFLLTVLFWILFALVEVHYTAVLYNDISVKLFDGGAGFEHALASRLGGLYALFNSSALIFQFFFAGYFLKNFGLKNVFLLHPLLLFFMAFLVFLGFGYWAGILLKNTFVITAVLFINAYHVAFYLLPLRQRVLVREFSESLLRPLAAFLGGFIALFFPLNLGLLILFFSTFLYFLIDRKFSVRLEKI